MMIWELLKVSGSGQFTLAVVIAASEVEARRLISKKAGWDPLASQQIDWMDAKSVVCRSIGTATEEAARIVIFVSGNFLSPLDRQLDGLYARAERDVR